MYKVTVTADGTTATASNPCFTMQQAEQVRAKLSEMLLSPAKIDIVPIDGDNISGLYWQD